MVFDCCRENLNGAKYRSVGVEEEMNFDRAAYRNLIIINGCPPNDKVAAKSSIAAELFRKIESLKDPRGTIVLPG